MKLAPRPVIQKTCPLGCSEGGPKGYKNRGDGVWVHRVCGLPEKMYWESRQR